MKKQLTKERASRREFFKKATYVVPAILTLQAAPEFAKAGSIKPLPNPPRPPIHF